MSAMYSLLSPNSIQNGFTTNEGHMVINLIWFIYVRIYSYCHGTNLCKFNYTKLITQTKSYHGIIYLSLKHFSRISFIKNALHPRFEQVLRVHYATRVTPVSSVKPTIKNERNDNFHPLKTRNAVWSKSVSLRGVQMKTPL